MKPVEELESIRFADQVSMTMFVNKQCVCAYNYSAIPTALKKFLMSNLSNFPKKNQQKKTVLYLLKSNFYLLKSDSVNENKPHLLIFIYQKNSKLKHLTDVRQCRSNSFEVYVICESAKTQNSYQFAQTNYLGQMQGTKSQVKDSNRTRCG